MTSVRSLVILIAVSLLTSYISGDITRSDYVSTITPQIFTDWGEYGVTSKYCDPGNYVVGFRLKTHNSRWTGEDATGVNRIRLTCDSWCENLRSVNTHIVQSNGRDLGEWNYPRYCPYNYFMNGAGLRAEAHGPGDDTALNNMKMHCKNTDGAGNVSLEGFHAGEKGTWAADSYCPDDTFVCGVNAQVEPDQGFGDDTSINHVRFHCCSVTLIGCGSK